MIEDHIDDIGVNVFEDGSIVPPFEDDAHARKLELIGILLIFVPRVPFFTKEDQRPKGFLVLKVVRLPQIRLDAVARFLPHRNGPCQGLHSLQRLPVLTLGMEIDEDGVGVFHHQLANTRTEYPGVRFQVVHVLIILRDWHRRDRVDNVPVPVFSRLTDGNQVGCCSLSILDARHVGGTTERPREVVHFRRHFLVPPARETHHPVWSRQRGSRVESEKKQIADRVIPIKDAVWDGLFRRGTGMKIDGHHEMLAKVMEVRHVLATSSIKIARKKHPLLLHGLFPNPKDVRKKKMGGKSVVDMRGVGMGIKAVWERVEQPRLSHHALGGSQQVPVVPQKAMVFCDIHFPAGSADAIDSLPGSVADDTKNPGPSPVRPHLVRGCRLLFPTRFPVPA